LLFCQPLGAGKAALQQFLRLKVAAQMLSGASAGAMASLRGQLAAGASLEVAGYTLSSVMASELERAALLPPSKPQPACRLEWIELSSLADAPPLAPASLQALGAWQEAGCSVHSQVVAGPAFWQTAEIEEAPNLLTATVAALTRAGP
jgi:exosortase A-associated hydrolase 2